LTDWLVGWLVVWLIAINGSQ